MKILILLLIQIFFGQANLMLLKSEEKLSEYRIAKKEIEDEVLTELNLVRNNPKAYALKYIQPRIKDFSGKKYLKLNTREGSAVVSECIEEMSQKKKMQTLSRDARLAAMAMEYTQIQGKTTETGHETGGKNFKKRAEKIVNEGQDAGEIISYGAETAREIVIQLLIDDGVKSRGHRRFILKENFSKAGVAFGPHTRFKSMCTIILSGAAQEK